MRREGLSTTQVLWALVGLRVRRIGNRMGALRRRGQARKKRGATRRKTTRSTPLMLAFGALLVFNSVNLCAQFLRGVDGALEARYAGTATADGPERFRLIPDLGAWAEGGLSGEARRTAAVTAGLILGLVILAVFFANLGAASREVSQAGWGLEWLYGFPVATRGLMLAQTGEYALTNLFGWFTVFPFLLTLLVALGWGWPGALLSVAATFPLLFLIGALRLFTETWMRKRLALPRIKALQAGATIIGMVFLFALMILALRSEEGPAFLVDLAASLGTWVFAVPLVLPGSVVLTPWAVLGIWALGALVVGLAVFGAGRLVRDGLVSAGGPYAGARGRGGARRAESPRLASFLGKEVRLLFRDRNFMVQTLITPLIMVAFWLLMDRGPGGTAATGVRGAAVLAFGVGAYVLMFGGSQILVVEQNALWLLFTFPQRLDRLLRQKAWLWSWVGVLYSAAVLAVVWRSSGAATAIDWLSPVLALAGVALCGQLMTGIAALGTDPFESEVSHRLPPGYSYLYLVIAGLYGAALATSTLWNVLVMVALLGLLGSAIWQKAALRLPVLLDPMQQPPPLVTAVDGIIASVLFFQLQALIGVAVAAIGGSLGLLTAAIAYAIASLVTVAAMLYVFVRRRVPELGRQLALAGGQPVVRGLAVGVGAGLLTAGFGAVYLQIAREIPAARELIEEAVRSAARLGANDRVAIGLLAIVLAPLLEEFIFRGLLYRGLRRTRRVRVALPLSAAVFAAVHPPLSFVPVFALGLVTAWLVERTGSLWSAVAAHATYNALVVIQTVGL